MIFCIVCPEKNSKFQIVCIGEIIPKQKLRQISMMLEPLGKQDIQTVSKRHPTHCFLINEENTSLQWREPGGVIVPK